MSGWTEIEEGTIKIIHHSTASIIELLITADEEVEEGKLEKVITKLLIDYATFSDLRKVINQTQFP